MYPQKAFISRSGGRAANEDHCAYLERDRFGCYLLADGLGGHRGGAIASRTVVESILEAFSASPGVTVEKMKGYVDYAREKFNNEKKALPQLTTTLVILLTDGSSAIWSHIGDSRLYYFQSGVIVTRTKDHSIPQLMADAGDINPEQIRFHEDRNRLTGAFDGGEMTRFEFFSQPVVLKRKDAFLLCSDGFWEYVYETEMIEDLERSSEPQGWLKRMERRLLRRADVGHDNYSAMAVRIR